jgi:hypothetical protein
MRTFCPDLPLCREASNCSGLHPFGRFSSTSGRHSMFDQLWEDRCNLPDNMDSRPDALIHKACIAFKIQTSGRQSSWSGLVSIRYGNCVHQINRPDDHPLVLDTRSLGMEITCSGSVTGLHSPDAAQIRKEFQ